MRSRLLVLAALVAALGCNAGDDGDVATGPQAEPEGDAVLVECGGSTFDVEQLTDGPTIESLAEGPAGAVDDVGAPAFDPTLDWRVVAQTADRADLVRELDEPVDQGGGDVRTHESRTLAVINGAGNIPDGTWLLMSSGPCSPRLVGDPDLGTADLVLAAEPAAEATSIDLLVHERACASGRSAEGRIEVVALEETDQEVRIRIGVRPFPGGQDCQGNPRTPFTVELDAPLGDRTVVDASFVPPRPVGPA